MEQFFFLPSLKEDLLENLQRLTQRDLHDPHALLGLHLISKSQKVIRLFRPGATEVYLELLGKNVKAKLTSVSGVFEYPVSAKITPLDYRVYHQEDFLAYDPYSFFPTFSPLDEYLLAKGKHYQLYDKLGAHLVTHQGCQGVKFAVWAPNARQVSLVADFNSWDGRLNPMRALGSSGVWELFVPGLEEGEKYKFEICTAQDEVKLKADPYANASEMRPKNASVVANLNRFSWNDQQWMIKRQREQKKPKPINVYEVHLGSWKREGEQFPNYRTLAGQLVKYCKEMGYTHVELMPILEHPLDESWGYQVTGYFSPTSRFGISEDFQYFVDTLHCHEIGVFLDWVPAHFPTDDFALARFDGTALYEHEDPMQGLHPHWGTYIFNYGRFEVSNFLIASALFWLDKMHIDGLRVDAVASMLYLDYGREGGNWIPNHMGGKENLEAIAFIRHLNSVVHHRCPGTLMIAEESTAFSGVTRPVSEGGLGFDMKWNMGWMNDSLHYFSQDPSNRSHHHYHLTHILSYSFTENFMLSLSHDEVVHGKKSLLSKMSGTEDQAFANLRLLLSYQICMPGKKLLFMGQEIAQWKEWNASKEIEWFLLKYPTHSGIHHFTKEINHFYLTHSSLWECDFDPSCFEWVDFRDTKNSVISYLRRGTGEMLLCVHNFAPCFHEDYQIPLKNVKKLTQCLNSDELKFGGAGRGKRTPQRVEDGSALSLELAPLATHVFSVVF